MIINAERKNIQPEWTVILPIYNEESNISDIIPPLIKVLKESNKVFEIIAVDDGSTDNSLQILHSYKKIYPNCIRIISHTVNKGMGAALRTGIRFARSEILICMDCDGQHDPKYIPELVSYIPPYDMVVAARTKNYQGKWYRNLANRFYNLFASWVTESQIDDLTSGFRAFRRQVIFHYLNMFPMGYSMSTTTTLIMFKGGYSVKYVPVHVKARQKGSSKIRIFRDGWRFIIIIIRMIVLYDPIRIFLPVSIFGFLMGVVTMIAGIIAANRLVIPGSSVVLFVASISTILLGLVSSQISNIAVKYYGDEFVNVYEDEIENE